MQCNIYKKYLQFWTYQLYSVIPFIKFDLYKSFNVKWHENPFSQNDFNAYATVGEVYD
jgi:hypothetical protein